MEAALAELQRRIDESERMITALVDAEGNHVNPYWGYMSRAGFADKSHLMRQIEKYADIYTSRVSNLLPYTPYKQFLCQRQSLAHSSHTGDAEASTYSTTARRDSRSKSRNGHSYSTPSRNGQTRRPRFQAEEPIENPVVQ